MPIKLTYEYVKNYFEERDYQLLSEEYKNCMLKLKTKCPNNHIFWTSYNNFQRGKRCSECYGNKKHTYEEVKNYIESFEGYKIVSEKYKNAHSKIVIQCPDNHIFETSFTNFQQGKRCPFCDISRKKTNQEIVEALYLYENIRENRSKQIEVKCIYCGQWYIPERNYLTYRIQYINGYTQNESRLYCSQGCKNNCPIYYQKIWPKGHKLVTSREVQPELRRLVFKRDNYTCQKCSKYKDELEVGLHCHHIYPLNEDPIQSADIDTCETLCEDCHKWIHQNAPGCGYGEMRCDK